MRRSLCRRTSWRRPVRTSGEEGAGRGRAARSPGAGRAGRGPGVSVPTPQPLGSPWSPLSAGSLPAEPCRAPRTAPVASPTARSGRPRAPRRPGVDPVPGPQSPPPSLLRFPQPGARPGLRAPQAPRRRPGPARDSHPRAGRGRAGEEPPPPPGPADGPRLKFAGPFASKSTRGRRGQRPGAPLPRRSQTNNFHLGCGQRESPIGSSP